MFLIFETLRANKPKQDIFCDAGIDMVWNVTKSHVFETIQLHTGAREYGESVTILS